jgi:hypothetical protein
MCRNEPEMLVGRAPQLAGQLCEAFICQGFAHDGELVENANVVYLCFAGAWHKLVIDCGVIFWRPWLGHPSQSIVASEGWEYQFPHVDVAAIAGIIGHRLKEYSMTTTPAAKVTFFFDNERTITIEDENDLSTFRID